MDKQFLTLGLVLFTEVLGFSLILPFLPYMAEDLGATPFIVGLIIASFSIFQFISAPIIGKLSDKYGRKPLLIISQISTFIGFMVLGLANTLFLIFLSRIIDGLFGSNMTLTNTYLSDLTKGKNRAKRYGYFGAIFGLGFFIGPAIGGFLATISYSIPAYIAAGITLLSIILTVVFLKETVKKEKEIKLRKEDFFPVKDFIKGLKDNRLKKVYSEYFFFILAFTMITSSLALFVKHQLGFGPEDVGIALMLIGLFRIIFQVTAMPKIIDKLSERTIRLIGIITTMVSMLLTFFITTRSLFYITLIIFGIGGGLTRPMIITELSNKTKKNERGKAMGVLDSLGSISQIIGPLIGGYVIGIVYPGTIGLIAASMLFIALLIELRYKPNTNKHTKA